MTDAYDTIVAPITGFGKAAVGVIRLSGPESWLIAQSLFSGASDFTTHHAVYGRFSTGDDGLVLPFEAGHGFTGEQAVEMSIHGSPASMAAMLTACREAGARLAEPGEFSLRAFMNGRLDLTEAEGVRDTVEAETAVQLANANRIRSGELSREVGAVEVNLVAALAEIEAHVDFSEELGDLDRDASISRIEAAQKLVARLLEGARAGVILRQGFRIALAGLPNSGKSSLLNALLGTDRSIVSESPGTTRDFVEERIDLDGLPCVLIDTAGLRASLDEVEAIGVQRSWAQVESADEVWYVYDAAKGWSPDDEENCLAIKTPIRIIANKCDLASASPGIPVSAVTREGLDRLIAEVKRTATPADLSQPLIGPRHAESLSSVHQHLEAAQKTLQQDLPFDLCTVLLQASLNELGTITGQTASADMLHEVFSKFCVGK